MRDFECAVVSERSVLRLLKREMDAGNAQGGDLLLLNQVHSRLSEFFVIRK